MRLVDGEILIATLDRPDFERARRAIDGFAEWATYEDFQCDRDGWVIGLASAGHSARFTPVSLDRFLSWSACAGVAPTVERLNEFVELVESFAVIRTSRLRRACRTSPVARAKRRTVASMSLSTLLPIGNDLIVSRINHRIRCSTLMPASFWSSGLKDRGCPHSPTGRYPVDHAVFERLRA